MAHQEHHDHGDDHAEAHDDHHEPPPPEEPQTPLWFTLFGATLFVLGGIAFLVMTADPTAEGAAKEGAAKEGAARPAQTAAPRPAQTAPAPTQGTIQPVPLPRPALSGLPGLRRAVDEKK